MHCRVSVEVVLRRAVKLAVDIRVTSSKALSSVICTTTFMHSYSLLTIIAALVRTRCMQLRCWCGIVCLQALQHSCKYMPLGMQKPGDVYRLWFGGFYRVNYRWYGSQVVKLLLHHMIMIIIVVIGIVTSMISTSRVKDE